MTFCLAPASRCFWPVTLSGEQTRDSDHDIGTDLCSTSGWQGHAPVSGGSSCVDDQSVAVHADRALKRLIYAVVLQHGQVVRFQQVVDAKRLRCR